MRRSEQACADAAQGEVVQAVNYNSPAQVVIAGHARAVNRAVQPCEGARRQARAVAARERTGTLARC
jgi:[acyl-carrier-protein] S-malonyltransferase